MVIVCAVFLLAYGANQSSAVALKSQQYGKEGRFRTWTFYPNTVYYFTGYYLNPTYIEFDEGEQVSTISTPKPTAWQFVPNGNRLFLKPIEDDADTTATVMTNKRVYFFELHAQDPSGPFDQNIAFFIKFRYPQSIDKNAKPGTPGEDNSVIQYASNALPDLSKKDAFNFNYTMSGDDEISPVAVFDDDKFTYMKFKDGGVFPAIFAVDANGFEGLINFRVVADYVVIEKTSPVFVLRNGPETVCIFNENEIKRNGIDIKNQAKRNGVKGWFRRLISANPR